MYTIDIFIIVTIAISVLTIAIAHAALKVEQVGKDARFVSRKIDDIQKNLRQ